MTMRSGQEMAQACAKAGEVAGAYAAAPQPAGAERAVSVQVDGQTWVCQDRQGDDDPDPHGLCASTSDESEEEVRLYS